MEIHELGIHTWIQNPDFAYKAPYGVTRRQWVKSYVHVSYVVFYKTVHVNAELKCILCRVQFW